MKNLAENFGTINPNLLVCRYKGWDIFNLGSGQYVARKVTTIETLLRKSMDTTAFGMMKEIDGWEDAHKEEVITEGNVYYMPGIKLEDVTTGEVLETEGKVYQMPALNLKEIHGTPIDLDGCEQEETVVSVAEINHWANQINANKIVQIAKWGQN